MIRDQVADGANLAIEDQSGGLGVARRAACRKGPRAIRIESRPLGRSPHLGQRVGHIPVCGTELLLTGHHIVVCAPNRAQAVGQQWVVVQQRERVCSTGMSLRQQDLPQDEFKIVLNEFHAGEVLGSPAMWGVVCRGWGGWPEGILRRWRVNPPMPVKTPA